MPRPLTWPIAAVAASIALIPSGVMAQSLSLGLIGGVGLTDAARNQTIPMSDDSFIQTSSPTKDWIAGASVELRLHSHFAVEVDGMYRALRLSSVYSSPDYSEDNATPAPVSTWEFPVLAKYRFRAGPLRPFVEAGPSFRITGHVSFTPSHYGATAGVGVETRWRGMVFAPVVRYTHWAHDEVGYDYFGDTQTNQVELLLGIHPDVDSGWRPFGGRLSVGAVTGWGLGTDYPSRTSTYPTVIYSSGPGGFTQTQAIETETFTSPRSLMAGPALEVRIWRHLAVEVDALRKPLQQDLRFALDGKPYYESGTYPRETTWQIPVLAKYRFRVRRISPFVEAGPSFRLSREWGLGLATCGVTVGAGVEKQLGTLRLAPAFRFTRWGTSDWQWWGLQGTPQNEAAIILGFFFGGAPVRSK